MGKPAKGRVTGCYSFRPGQKHPTVALSLPGPEAGRETGAKGHGGLPYLTSRRGDGRCWQLGDEGDARIPIPADPPAPLPP